MFEIGSSESTDPLVSEDVKPLACRCCLAVERPLRPLERALASLYEQLTGTPVSQSDIYPKFLCSYCRVLLLKFSAFRRKCCSVQETFLNLHSTGITITTKLLQSGIAGLPYPYFKPVFLQPISIDSHAQSAHNYGSVNQTTVGQESSNIIENNVLHDFLKHDRRETFVDKLDICKTENNVGIQIEVMSLNEINVPEATNIVIDSVFVDGKKIKSERSEQSYSTKKNCILKETRRKNASSKVKRTRSKISRLKRKQNEDVMDTFSCDSDDEVLSEIKPKIEKSKRANKGSRKTKRSSSDASIKELQVFIRKIKSEKKKSNTNVDRLSKLERYYERVREASAKKYNVTIIKLSKEEQIRQFMARQDAPRYMNARYKCEVCYTGFPYENRYKTHMADHEIKEGDEVCDICNRKYTKKDRRKHLNHRFNYVCNKCGFVCQTMDVATIHYRSHKGRKYECKICGKTFNRSHSVYGHMHLSHGGSTTCPICGKKFIGQKGLHSHINMSHKEAVGAVCPTCSVQFHSHDALRRHRPQDGSCDPTHRPCAECGEGFTTDQLLQQHQLGNHKKIFTCEECGKIFENIVKYESHMHHHIPRKTQTKSPTPKQNPTPRQRQNQVQAFTENSSTLPQLPRLLMCEVCGIIKQSPIALASHMRSHTKPFQCDYCQRCFSAKTSLESHIYLHMAVQPASRKQFFCRYCPKTFFHYSNKVRHEKGVHIKQQSFTCELCGSTYQYKESLQAHINTKHLGKPWPRRIRNQRKI